MSGLINLTGLWTPKEKGGKVVMSGSAGMVKYIVFKNDRYEEGSNMPKYNLCLAQVEKRNDEAKADAPDDDDIPF